GVREAAARTLGQVHPVPEAAAAALGRMLGTGEPSRRLAAADGLAYLMAGGEGDLVRVGCAVLPASLPGAADVCPEVRRRCLATIGGAADALQQAALLGNGAQPGTCPLTPRAELLPLLLALEDQWPALGCALADPDAEVRGRARLAVESL